MEQKIITGIVLNYKNDEVLNLCFLDILTLSSLVKIKLPQSFTKYKYKHLLEPQKLNKIEIVKTAKNWILKSVLSSKDYIKFSDYKSYLDFTRIVKEVSSALQENEQTNVLDILLDSVNQDTGDFDFDGFSKKFSEYQGNH